MQPKALFVVSELPRNTMGKVHKAALRQKFSEHFSKLDSSENIFCGVYLHSCALGTSTEKLAARS